MSNEEERTRRARQIAEARYGFLWHLPIYIIVNLTLVAIWSYSGAGFPWPIFPIFFWGIGIVGHYVSAYRSSGGGWIERETENILRKEDEARKPEKGLIPGSVSGAGSASPIPSPTA